MANTQPRLREHSEHYEGRGFIAVQASLARKLQMKLDNALRGKIKSFQVSSRPLVGMEFESGKHHDGESRAFPNNRVLWSNSRDCLRLEQCQKRVPEGIR